MSQDGRYNYNHLWSYKETLIIHEFPIGHLHIFPPGEPVVIVVRCRKPMVSSENLQLFVDFHGFSTWNCWKIPRVTPFFPGKTHRTPTRKPTPNAPRDLHEAHHDVRFHGLGVAQGHSLLRKEWFICWYPLISMFIMVHIYIYRVI